jgi:hypothetical protein
MIHRSGTFFHVDYGCARLPGVLSRWRAVALVYDLGFPCCLHSYTRTLTHDAHLVALLGVRVRVRVAQAWAGMCWVKIRSLCFDSILP